MHEARNDTTEAIAQSDEGRCVDHISRDRSCAGQPTPPVRRLRHADPVSPSHRTPTSPVTPEASTDTGLLACVLAALEDAVTALREQLTQANWRADRERQRGDEALTRADALRDRLDAAQAQLAAAEDAARSACADARVVQDWATAVERANAARRSAGVLTRLRAAWRGE
jgi:hypothetical protein